MLLDAILLLSVMIVVPAVSILILRAIGKTKRTRRPVHRFRGDHGAHGLARGVGQTQVVGLPTEVP